MKKYIIAVVILLILTIGGLLAYKLSEQIILKRMTALLAQEELFEKEKMTQAVALAPLEQAAEAQKWKKQTTSESILQEAIHTRDPKVCKEMINSQMETHCREQVALESAITNKDISLCQHTGEEKSRCENTVKTMILNAKKSPNDCTTYKDATEKEACFQKTFALYFATPQNQKEDACTTWRDKNVKASCINFWNAHRNEYATQANNRLLAFNTFARTVNTGTYEECSTLNAELGMVARCKIDILATTQKDRTKEEICAVFPLEASLVLYDFDTLDIQVKPLQTACLEVLEKTKK